MRIRIMREDVTLEPAMEEGGTPVRNWPSFDFPLIGAMLMAGLFSQLALLFLLLSFIGGVTLYQVFAHGAPFPPPYLWLAYILSCLFAGVFTALTYWLMKTCWSDAKLKHPNLVTHIKPPFD